MTVETEEGTPKKTHAYLAGPDVFLPNPIQIGKDKKAILARYGIEGHFPFDNELPLGENKEPRELAFAIAKGNEEMMSTCNVVFANLMPWYGPGTDNGTSFEMGFMSARAMHDPNILIIGYYPDGIPEKFSARISSMVYNGKVSTSSEGFVSSTETGRGIESFGLSDNLMIEGAIQKTGGKIYGSFEEAAANVKNLLAEKQQKQSAQKENKSSGDKPSPQEQPLAKKDENTLWGYSLAKCSVVGTATAVVGVAIAAGLGYTAGRSKCF
ncbi:MAG TPA: nucleoside 2-deoxyribosyltransferase [Gammaproteobacteria bacterium]|nr:nucleoside 2-deoxyribosyltransferase [Gammaproteobacteria bacterium]